MVAQTLVEETEASVWKTAVTGNSAKFNGGKEEKLTLLHRIGKHPPGMPRTIWG